MAVALENVAAIVPAAMLADAALDTGPVTQKVIQSRQPFICADRIAVFNQFKVAEIRKRGATAHHVRGLDQVFMLAHLQYGIVEIRPAGKRVRGSGSFLADEAGRQVAVGLVQIRHALEGLAVIAPVLHVRVRVVAAMNQ